MTTDDDRIRYLAGEGGDDLDEAEAGDLDELRALLADRSVWVEPDDRVEDAVVAAITAEAGSPRRHRSRALAAVGIAAAALVVIVAMAVAINAGGSADTRQLAADLYPTELVPDAEGQATLTKTDSGWRIELDATGLPRLDRGRFYQAWLRSDEDVLVTIGTFNEPEDVVLWAGVSPLDFRTLTVTEEEADGDPSSSGRRVLVGVAVGD